MTEDSVDAVIAPVKYGRGQNPASLGNLKPWEPGQSGNPVASRGPIVTPALRRLVETTEVEEIEALHADKERFAKLRTVDALALCMVHDAIQTGLTAIKNREIILNRLDGEPEKSAPAVAVQVNLTFGDGEQA